ncbi:MAG: hypothetical protein U1E05_02565 [Patescibacteria group bacterium]|nr:hypothetical protein [Patescibacteria group bacterium]
MKRIALALTVLAVLALSTQQLQAGPPRHHGPKHHGPQYHQYHKHHHHRHGGPHGSRYYVPPRVVYPAPVYRPYYGRAYVAPAYPYYYGPSSGFYYRGSGVSIGIGF